MNIEELRKYIFNKIENQHISTEALSRELGIPWIRVRNIYQYEKSITDGALKIIKTNTEEVNKEGVSGRTEVRRQKQEGYSEEKRIRKADEEKQERERKDIKKQIREDRDNKIIELYNNAYSIRDIANELEISNSTVMNVLKKHKIEKRHVRSKVYKNEVANIIDRINNGEDKHAVALELNITMKILEKIIESEQENIQETYKGGQVNSK